MIEARDVMTTRMLEDEAAGERFAAELALMLGPGDCVCLEGDLGAGKTTLARALVKALSPAGAMPEVPSPTFTLVQTYDETRIPVAHYDCYRLKGEEEIAETGFEDDLVRRLVLIEWPERIASRLPPDRLTVRLEISGSGRRLTLGAEGAMRERLSRFLAIPAFLARHGWGDAGRRFLVGDASSRRYERLMRGDGERAVLMDMPERPDGPPVKDGMPYSRLVHLAEDCRAVLAVNAELRRRGYSAPAALAHDAAQGFVLLEDLGERVYGRLMEEGADISEPFLAATMLLADMARHDWPEEVPVPGGGSHRLHRFDADALTVEASLLLDWFLPFVLGRAADKGMAASYGNAWAAVLPLGEGVRPVWVLRDYHSPNLVWLPEREGLARVGLIDTQDAVIGHPAYDLVSLLRDARVDVPAGTAGEYFDYYCALRAADESDFDRARFEAAYALFGAQRACKVLGIFTRLSRRDGKHGYLRHLPRVSDQLERALAHPALQPLARWFADNLARPVRDEAIAAVLPKR
jgi:hypothetical protein